jgi:hypothetical protein
VQKLPSGKFFGLYFFNDCKTNHAYDKIPVKIKNGECLSIPRSEKAGKNALAGALFINKFKNKL